MWCYKQAAMNRNPKRQHKENAMRIKQTFGRVGYGF
jgi:hypothetical protein